MQAGVVLIASQPVVIGRYAKKSPSAAFECSYLSDGQGMNIDSIYMLYWALLVCLSYDDLAGIGGPYGLIPSLRSCDWYVSLLPSIC